MSTVKAVIVLVVLAGLGLGFYLFSADRNKGIGPVSTPTPIATPSGPEMSPTEVTQGFYTQYEDCLINSPAPAAGQVSLYCQSHNPFITGTFSINLEQGGVAQAGADPVVCAQDLPQEITMGSTSIEGNTAQVKVVETFGPSPIQLIVSLLKQDNGWRVDNVTCPKPQ